MKKIRYKIIFCIVAVAIILCSALTAISVILCKDAVLKRVNYDMTQITKSASQNITWQISLLAVAAQEIARDNQIIDPNVSWTDKEAILKERGQQYGFSGYEIYDSNGISLATGKDASKEPFFIQSMQGKTKISSPYIDEMTGKIKIDLSAPIIRNGNPAGCLLINPDAGFLNTLVSDIKVGDTGEAYIVDNQGTVIAAEDTEQVLQMNAIKAAETVPSMKEIAEVTKRTIEGQTNVESYKVNGTTYLASYCPVNTGDGWSVFVASERNEYTRAISNAALMMIGATVIFVILGVVLANFLSKGISDPIVSCVVRLTSLADGDLKSPSPMVKTKDETGILADALDALITRFNKIISGTDHVLSSISAGNLTVSCSDDHVFKGDFKGLQVSISNLTNSLSSTINKIDNTAVQVSTEAGQMADSATQLSQGAAEQAASVEELAATIAEITGQINSTAHHSDLARDTVLALGGELDESNRQMQRLVSAMTEINNSSQEISMIIKTIEEIAFQTNILSLNAAVEAARAGTAGKGFAVVAEEVRNLAHRSAEAANSTTSIIEQSIKAVQNGVSLVNTTGEMLSSAVLKSSGAVSTMEEISRYAKQQAESANQITVGVDQVSGVVQTNSSAAEELAASSEELSSQAHILKDLVGRFITIDGNR